MGSMGLGSRDYETRESLGPVTNSPIEKSMKVKE